jgi:hypothetical protein
LSEETILKFKMATIVSAIVGLMALIQMGMGAWMGFVQSKQSSQGELIATLQAQSTQHNELLLYIRSTIDDIRDDQIRRTKRENK